MKKRRPWIVALLLGWLAVTAVYSQQAEPSDAANDVESWVERTFAGLTLEQKVGQIILARASGQFHGASDAELERLLDAMAAGRIGGVVVFGGPPRETLWLTDRLRSVAPLPPLIASDYEWGVAMRVPGATRFPSAMALAAQADGGLAAVEALASVTAREARALGVDLVLAPVLDLAVDPGSTVISRRSFGADAERVALLGARFIEALQSGGVLATAKHFPGHGATSSDSHEGSALVELDLERLRRVEMRPFEAAIEAGVAAVMPGHLVVPALDPSPGRPATRSPEILRGWLRTRLGFDGLIVSDALEMAGARLDGWDGGNTIATVSAGVDLVLAPPDPQVAFRELVRAAESGELEMARLDDAVRRVLRAKARLRSMAPLGDQDELEEVLSSPDARLSARLSAQRSVTLVSDRGVLPLSSTEPPDVVLVTVTRDRDRNTDLDTLESELRRRANTVRTVDLTPRTVASRVAEVAWALGQEPSSTLVVAHAAHHTAAPVEALEEMLSNFDRDRATMPPPVVILSLLDPWSLTLFDSLTGPTAHMTSYDPSPDSQSALAGALFGETEISGRLPVALSPTWPIGTGLLRPPAVGQAVPVETPESFDPESFDRVKRVMLHAIEERATPGAALVVGQGGRIVIEQAFGKLSYEPDAKEVSIQTLWDLASLTKVIVTTTLTMKHVEDGRLELDAPVGLYVPEFVAQAPVSERPVRDGITVRDLLTHSSGVLWWTDLYLRYGELPPPQAHKEYLKEIVSLPLENPPRSKTVYSDLGILLLGEILQRLGGAGLDVQARELIFDPLQMNDTRFSPSPELWPRVAPTERDPWRGRVVRGEVHDENAYGLGGVAAHAGLFSTAPDLARFARMLLSGGVYEGTRILNGKTIQQFTHRAEVVEGSSRALGWDTPSGERSSAGSYLSSRSFGHTGFTGTSLWMDPERDLFVVLLTNRVHPSRENTKIRQLRSDLHDAVVLDLEGDGAIRRDP